MKDNDRLVDSLVETGRIESEKVEDAFRSIDRAVFIPNRYSAEAYEDNPVPIGDEETVSAPHMVAINTELLEPEKDSRVLEIGSGSGYQAAILGKLSGKVVGVEIEEGLVEKSRERIEGLGLENVSFKHGSGFEPVDGSFDRILFSCGITDEMFEEAKKYLSEKGILLAPVSEGHGQVLKKFSDGETSNHGAVRFVGFKD